MTEKSAKSRKSIRQRFHPGGSPRKKNIYHAFQPVTASAVIPREPLYRYETSRVGYAACKFVLPAAAAVTYLSFLIRSLWIDSMPVAYALFSPWQLISLVLTPLLLYLTRPLAHIIICEEGMFVVNGFKRVFVPWRYLRSYHGSAYLQPWVIIISYYYSKKKYRRMFAITSLETEHTLVEIMTFIRKVRQNSEPETEAVSG